MYLRPAFVETDLTRIAALIAAHPFGVLVTRGPTEESGSELGGSGMAASHVPFTVARDGDALVLEAHLAAANPQCAQLVGGAALAIFTGPHAYISPSWYQAQPSVPTWDYAAVHVHGHLEPIDDPDACLRMLAADDPARFDHGALPERYRAAMFAGIRAFRLRSERIEAQWKMSQNRNATDRQGVIAALRASGEAGVADLIAATLPR